MQTTFYLLAELPSCCDHSQTGELYAAASTVLQANKTVRKLRAITSGCPTEAVSENPSKMSSSSSNKGESNIAVNRLNDNSSPI